MQGDKGTGPPTWPVKVVSADRLGPPACLDPSVCGGKPLAPGQPILRPGQPTAVLTGCSPHRPASRTDVLQRDAERRGEVRIDLRGRLELAALRTREHGSAAREARSWPTAFGVPSARLSALPAPG